MRIEIVSDSIHIPSSLGVLLLLSDLGGGAPCSRGSMAVHWIWGLPPKERSERKTPVEQRTRTERRTLRGYLLDIDITVNSGL